MPALNEERNISKAIDSTVVALKRAGVSGEIIVINDGSTDRTASIVADKIKEYPFIRLISHTSPQGVGASYWDGVKAAQGELVTWIPGDGEDDADEHLIYLHLLDHVDMVVPYVYNPGGRSRRRQLLSKLFKAVINLSFGTLLNYANGATIYRRCVLQGIELRTKGFFFQVELLIKAIRTHYMYAEVPIILSKRLSGKSKAVTFRSFVDVTISYFRMLWMVYGTSKKKLKIHPGSLTWKRLQSDNDIIHAAESMQKLEPSKGLESVPPMPLPSI